MADLTGYHFFKMLMPHGFEDFLPEERQEEFEKIAKSVGRFFDAVKRHIDEQFSEIPGQLKDTKIWCQIVGIEHDSKDYQEKINKLICGKLAAKGDQSLDYLVNVVRKLSGNNISKDDFESLGKNYFRVKGFVEKAGRLQAGVSRAGDRVSFVKRDEKAIQEFLKICHAHMGVRFNQDEYQGEK